MPEVRWPESAAPRGILDTGSKCYRGVGHRPVAEPHGPPAATGLHLGSVVVAFGGALAQDLEVGAELHLNLAAVVQAHLHLIG